MNDRAPVIWWVRRDLRLTDNPALSAALAGGGPVIPLFVRDATVDALGTAPAWRLVEGLAAFAAALADRGGRLILRAGAARTVLEEVIAATGARAVHWNRLYDPDAIARDTAVKAALREAGVAAESHGGHLLFEPWTVETKTGGMYKVYTPMWRAVKDREVAEPGTAPTRLPAPEAWPESESLADWRLGAGMRRGAEVVRRHILVGEEAARGRLGHFMAGIVDGYAESRDRVAEDGTSRMSAHLSLGEIGPRTCWHAGLRAREEGKRGAESFLQELVWREFAYHLLYHTPRLATDNWREEWAAFPWNEARTDEVIAWQRGRTGIAFVDAAMREMYVTGTMHNRARMIVASVLTKHLMSHWKIGLRWFEDHLVDWDPASNALGWQWSAGSGPDATPYFRVFNPETQLEKFDPDRAYVGRWIAEGRKDPARPALDYFEAIPPAWGMAPTDPYPSPVVTPKEGRARALAAYENRSF
jgi:deoxyribodipyrimidine photo-lyase